MNKDRAKHIEVLKEYKEEIDHDIVVVEANYGDFNIDEDMIVKGHELQEALDYAIYDMQNIEELEEKIKYLEKANEWVDVKDRLPSESGMYLVTNFDNVSYTTWTTTCHYKNKGFELDGVIAWKPLPKPYKRKE